MTTGTAIPPLPTAQPAESSHADPRLLVFSDDWGRHPSSCQHLIGRLLPRYCVDWVNTIGMRCPGLNWASVRRGLEKTRDWTPGGARQSSPPNLNVLRPLMWPWFSRPWDRTINRRVLTAQLRRRIASVGQPVIAVTTIPIVAELLDSLPVDRWVYYCVDDFSQWPGLDNRTLEALEKTLVARADCLIAVSEPLRQRLNHWKGADVTELLTHGIDLAHWQQSPSSDIDLPVKPAERPLIVFWGLVDRRMDVEFLRALSDSLTSGTIALVGPEDNPDPALAAIPHLRRFPPLPYSSLPALAHIADALIMPYADLPVTHAMQPLKLLEYLATDKPVIVRDLPATRAWCDCLDTASSAEEFAAIVARRLAEGLPAAQRLARTRLQDESWGAKAARFESLLRGHGMTGVRNTVSAGATT